MLELKERNRALKRIKCIILGHNSNKHFHLLLLFQSESKRETHKCFTRFKCKSNSFSYERFRTWTRFEIETKGNSEMAYSDSMRRLVVLPGCLDNSPIPITGTGRSQALWEKEHNTMTHRPSFEPKLLDPEFNWLTISPPRLPKFKSVKFSRILLNRTYANGLIQFG